MIAADLRRDLAGVTGPALVCAQAGEVDTGAVDPLGEIGRLVRARPGTWLHVDGAFGLWAAAARRCARSSPAPSSPTPGPPTRTSG